MRAYWLVLAVLLVHVTVEGKILTECEAAKELVKNRINKTFISNWVKF